MTWLPRGREASCRQVMRVLQWLDRVSQAQNGAINKRCG
jgi:hypothetical protein